MKSIPLISRWNEPMGDTLVDDDVYEWASLKRWSLARTGYAISHGDLMHRLILKVDGFLNKVDHINGDKLDNRRGNMRITDDVGNGANRTRLNSNNKSGFRGVRPYRRGNGRWKAEITHKYKNISCGIHDSVEAAIAAYQAKFIDLHGYCPFVRTASVSV